MVSHKYSADILLLLVTFIWGTTFALVKDAIEHVPVFVFLSQRFLLGGLCLLLFCFFRPRCFSVLLLVRSIILGLFLFGAFAFQTLGLAYTTASNAAFITGLNVVFVPVIERMWFRNHLSFGVWTGILFAVLGLFLLTTSGKFTVNLGDFLVLGCAICVAFHVICTGLYATKHDVMWLTTLELLTVGLCNFIIAYVQSKPMFVYYPGTALALVVCVFGATIFAFVVQTFVQRFASPTHVAIVFCMEPVFGAIFAYLYSGERFTGQQFVGAVLIILAMITAELGSREELVSDTYRSKAGLVER